MSAPDDEYPDLFHASRDGDWLVITETDERVGIFPDRDCEGVKRRRPPKWVGKDPDVRLVWYVAPNTMFSVTVGNLVIDDLEWDGRILRCGDVVIDGIEEPN